MNEYAAVRALVISPDFDETERALPTWALLKPGNMPRIRFSVVEQFKVYWMRIAKSDGKKQRIAKLKIHEYEQLAPDLVLVTASLGYRTGISIYHGVGEMRDVQKLLIKVGDQWKLFNGEWQGFDETNLSWTEKYPTTSSRTL